MGILETRLSLLEKENIMLQEKFEALTRQHEDTVTVLAALAEMIRRIDYDLNDEPFTYQRLGKHSISIDSEEKHNLPLYLSVVRLNNNSIRIDFISGDKIESEEDNN